MTFIAPTQEEFEATGAWGLLTAVDIYDCNPVTIRDAGMIRTFAETLCKRLAVKPYGEPTVVEFGNDPKVHGYSLTQLIESSNIGAHFAEQMNAVYLDIFSCKYYDPAEAVRYAMEFFGGAHSEAISVLRGSTQTLSADIRAELLSRHIILQPAKVRLDDALNKAA